MISKTSQNSVYVLQKQIVRSLCKVPLRQHCMPLFKKEKILTVIDQLKLDNCKLMFRIENGIYPVLVKNLYPSTTHEYHTRGGRVNVQLHKGSKMNKSFLCKAVLDSQHLSHDVRTLSNIKTFMNSIKKSLLDVY